MEQESLNEIKTGKILRDINIKSIIDIAKTGKNKVTINLKDWKEANRILRNPTLNKLHNFKSYIPNIFIKRTGIIFDVPEDLSDQELYDCYSVPGNVPIEKI